VVIILPQKPLKVPEHRVPPSLEVVVVGVQGADVRAYRLKLNVQQRYCSLLWCCLIVHRRRFSCRTQYTRNRNLARDQALADQVLLSRFFPSY
jgi:hypothetical protein